MLIDLDQLRNISRGNNSFVIEILDVFLKHAPKDLNLLREAYAKGNRQDLRYLSHKLKSSSNSIGFEEGAFHFGSIEKIIKCDDDLSGIESHLKHIIAKSETCFNMVREEKDKMSSEM